MQIASKTPAILLLKKKVSSLMPVVVFLPPLVSEAAWLCCRAELEEEEASAGWWPTQRRQCVALQPPRPYKHRGGHSWSEVTVATSWPACLPVPSPLVARKDLSGARDLLRHLKAVAPRGWLEGFAVGSIHQLGREQRGLLPPIKMQFMACLYKWFMVHNFSGVKYH